MLKTNRNILVVYLAACGLCYGQDQSRADQIESERIEKEANLSPETAPNAERKIEWVEKGPYFRLLTGSLDGFGLGFGTILPGSGFAIRPAYARPDLLGGRLVLRLEALGAINQSYLGGIHLSMPELLDGHAFWDFSVVHRDISEMPYYGPGPDSRKTGRSDYRLEDTNVEFRPGVRLHKGLRANLIGSYLAVPRTVVMDGAGDDLFSRPGFALNQGHGVALGNDTNLVQNVLKGGAMPDDFVLQLIDRG